jgi:EAL domain-containing protein (putative c-di-GMP-specific phosphodiesterase class I)
VLLANRSARALVASVDDLASADRSAPTVVLLGEDELVGADWVDAAVPAAERDGVRAALAEGGRAEHSVASGRRVSWRLSPLDEGAGAVGVWATGTVRAAPAEGSLEERLRRALAQDELRLHYQPIFGLRTGALVALEALLRWQDPDYGMVPPGEFIPVAERSGLIDEVGDWVLDAVCARQAAWASRGLWPHVSFNVSPSQLRRGDFVARVRERVEGHGVDPKRLTVELTESSTFEDPALAEGPLRELHAFGVRIALDDFGTGYSSLSRLRELPVTTLKIDRAFLRDVPERPEAAAMVVAILQLARALGRTAVAEGVETEAQRAFLAAEGCPLAQGYLLGAPAPPEQLEPLMAAPLHAPG